ncbi:hypothetical protein RB195_018139 [Necator americanus]|uniref:Uncharacterized protein n=1 Tax=Necator americanus TaxID=51031 RepID=A0ABR1CAR9_NECAM
MDWIWSWKDTMFYGICTFSKGAGAAERDPVPVDKYDAPLRLKSYRRNSMNSDFYIGSEMMRGSGLFTTAVPYSPNPDKSNDFLTLLEKMQSQRLDEQRCEMPDLHVS